MSEQVVQLTPTAIDKILSARAAEGFGAGHGLRLSVNKGGCSGYEYSVKFVPEPLENDVVFDVGRIRVFVDRDSEPLLRGTVLDYVDGLYGAGLRFVNPNAGHECGCGSSFAAAESGSGAAAESGSAAPADSGTGR
jgi:iron-sulfur cluster assembly protein